MGFVIHVTKTIHPRWENVTPKALSLLLLAQWYPKTALVYAVVKCARFLVLLSFLFNLKTTATPAPP